MKHPLQLIACSLLSAILAVAIYSRFIQPQKVIIETRGPAALKTHYETEGLDLFSGRLQAEFTSSAPTDFIEAAQRVTPAVVNIKALSSKGFDFWSTSAYGASTGSGVLVSPDGYIVTNNHVVEEGDRFQITLNDHREFEATLIGTDPTTDLALLKIEGENLPFLLFGNSDSLQVGEWVLAVGNPFNLESTVTAGIVSAKARNIQILEGDYSIESFIQTDAAVNPGNSGGALVNTNGELVGINTAIITRSGRYEGYSFAIPANLAQKVIRDLRDYGEVQRGLLGVRISPVDNHRAKELGLPKVEGVYISHVTKGGGAEAAGLRRGDVIIGINGVKVTTMPELQEQIGRYRPGNTILVEYIRRGKIFRTSVVLRDKNNSTVFQVNNDADNLLTRLGFEVRNLTHEETRALGTNGVYVVSVDLGSTIERTEMDPGYIITKVNDQPVASVEELLDELYRLQVEGKKVLLEGFYEDYPGEYYYTFYIK